MTPMQVTECRSQSVVNDTNALGQWAKIQFMVLVLLMLQNVYWYIRNTDFSVILCWNFSFAFRPKTPPTTPRALFWYIISGGPKWKLLMFVLFRDYNNSKYIQTELSNQGKVITNLLFSDISINICLFGLFRIVTSAGYKQNIERN